VRRGVRAGEGNGNGNGSKGASGWRGIEAPTQQRRTVCEDVTGAAERRPRSRSADARASGRAEQLTSRPEPFSTFALIFQNWFELLNSKIGNDTFLPSNFFVNSNLID
jgi:hypothetical protein